MIYKNDIHITWNEKYCLKSITLQECNYHLYLKTSHDNGSSFNPMVYIKLYNFNDVEVSSIISTENNVTVAWQGEYDNSQEEKVSTINFVDQITNDHKVNTYELDIITGEVGKLIYPYMVTTENKIFIAWEKNVHDKNNDIFYITINNP